MGFTIREFSHGETVGEKLLAMRREAKLTLREAAQLTKIRKSYIKAFEENAYGDLPETLYARNFLKAYVHLLGGDEDYFVDGSKKNGELATLLKPCACLGVGLGPGNFWWPAVL
ncbi:helix-turn-helix domain-containing protein [Patescibacteria group bacterium]|nr:helix-turn-helix domain-containing protein [Patescibacteria group bacterium]